MKTTIYKMVPKCINFIDSIDKVEIKEFEGEEINLKITVQYYKSGKTYEVIDKNLGLPILRYKGNKKVLIAYIQSQLPKYINTLIDNKERIIEINRLYIKAIERYKNDKNLMKEYDFNPLKELAKRGTGFVNGKLRILDYMIMSPDKNEAANYIKREYGFGGFGSPRKNNKEFQLCSGDWTGKKIKLEWYVPGKENRITGFYTWNQLTNEIDQLIKKGEYI